MSIIISLGFKVLGLLGFIKPDLASGWTRGAAKAAGIAALVLLLVILLGVGKCTYDNSVIDDYKGDQAVKDLGARDSADTEAAEREAADLDQERRQTEAAAKAAAQNPEAAGKPVGPVTQSYYDTLDEENEE